MKIVTLTPMQFDKFAMKHRYRNYYQTSAYGRIMNKFNYNIHYLGIVSDENKLIGATLIIYKEMFLNKKIAYAPRGLLINYDDEKLVKQIITKIKKLLGKQGFMSLKIDPYIPENIRNNKGDIINFNNQAETIRNNLIKAGFNYNGKNKFFENEKPRWEALVLLKRSDQEIYAKLDKATRNKIRKASSNGVTVIKDNLSNVQSLYKYVKNRVNLPYSFYKELIKNFKGNIELFYSIINTEKFSVNCRQLLEREESNNSMLNNFLQDVSISPEQRNKYLTQKMESDKLINFYKTNIVKSTDLLKKYPNGIKIAGALVITFDNAAFIFSEGQNEKYSTLDPLYSLKWYLIQYYNRKGYKYLNLNEIAGEFEEKHKYSELNESKLGFDTTVTEYIGEFEIILNGFSYNLFRNMDKK